MTPGQVRVVRALLDDHPGPPRYIDVAEALGVHVGTVYSHLRRLRLADPGLYAAVMERRQGQLSRWHAEVAERRRLRSLRWGRRRYAAGYRAEHGRWPWEGRST